MSRFARHFDCRMWPFRRALVRNPGIGLFQQRGKDLKRALITHQIAPFHETRPCGNACAASGPTRQAAVVDGLIGGFHRNQRSSSARPILTGPSKRRKRAPKDVARSGPAGAWTDDVDRLNDVGGRLMECPNVDAPGMRGRRSTTNALTMHAVSKPTEPLPALRSGLALSPVPPAAPTGGIKTPSRAEPKGCGVGAVGCFQRKRLSAYARGRASAPSGWESEPSTRPARTQAERGQLPRRGGNTKPNGCA